MRRRCLGNPVGRLTRCAVSAANLAAVPVRWPALPQHWCEKRGYGSYGSCKSTIKEKDEKKLLGSIQQSKLHDMSIALSVLEVTQRAVPTGASWIIVYHRVSSCIIVYHRVSSCIIVHSPAHWPPWLLSLGNSDKALVEKGRRWSVSRCSNNRHSASVCNVPLAIYFFLESNRGETLVVIIALYLHIKEKYDKNCSYKFNIPSDPSL